MLSCKSYNSQTMSSKPYNTSKAIKPKKKSFSYNSSLLQLRSCFVLLKPITVDIDTSSLVPYVEDKKKNIDAVEAIKPKKKSFSYPASLQLRSCFVLLKPITVDIDTSSLVPYAENPASLQLRSCFVLLKPITVDIDTSSLVPYVEDKKNNIDAVEVINSEDHGNLIKYSSPLTTENAFEQFDGIYAIRQKKRKKKREHAAYFSFFKKPFIKRRKKVILSDLLPSGSESVGDISPMKARTTAKKKLPQKLSGHSRRQSAPGKLLSKEYSKQENTKEYLLKGHNGISKDTSKNKDMDSLEKNVEKNMLLTDELEKMKKIRDGKKKQLLDPTQCFMDIGTDSSDPAVEIPLTPKRPRTRSATCRSKTPKLAISQKLQKRAKLKTEIADNNDDSSPSSVFFVDKSKNGCKTQHDDQPSVVFTSVPKDTPKSYSHIDDFRTPVNSMHLMDTPISDVKPLTCVDKSGEISTPVSEQLTFADELEKMKKTLSGKKKQLLDPTQCFMDIDGSDSEVEIPLTPKRPRTKATCRSKTPTLAISQKLHQRAKLESEISDNNDDSSPSSVFFVDKSKNGCKTQHDDQPLVVFTSVPKDIPKSYSHIDDFRTPVNSKWHLINTPVSDVKPLTCVDKSCEISTPVSEDKQHTFLRNSFDEPVTPLQSGYCVSLFNNTPSPSIYSPPDIKKNILAGIVCYVDCRVDKKEASQAVKSELRSLGAQVENNFTKKVKLVVFKEGRRWVYIKAKKEGIPIAGVLWIEECKKIQGIADVEKHPPKDMKKFERILPYQMLKKRRPAIFNPNSRIRRFLAVLSELYPSVSESDGDESPKKAQTASKKKLPRKFPDNHLLLYLSQNCDFFRVVKGPNHVCNCIANYNRIYNTESSSNTDISNELRHSRRQSAPGKLLSKEYSKRENIKEYLLKGQNGISKDTSKDKDMDSEVEIPLTPKRPRTRSATCRSKTPKQSAKLKTKIADNNDDSSPSSVFFVDKSEL